jgi:hypothetical protein
MATYTLVTPTLEQGPLVVTVCSHTLNNAQRVILSSLDGGTYSLIQYPTEDELATYTAYYMGGCQHTGISDAIRTAMIALRQIR